MKQSKNLLGYVKELVWLCNHAWYKPVRIHEQIILLNNKTQVCTEAMKILQHISKCKAMRYFMIMEISGLLGCTGAYLFKWKIQ